MNIRETAQKIQKLRQTIGKIRDARGNDQQMDQAISEAEQQADQLTQEAQLDEPKQSG
jgi:hypothetical protein